MSLGPNEGFSGLVFSSNCSIGSRGAASMVRVDGLLEILNEKVTCKRQMMINIRITVMTLSFPMKVVKMVLTGPTCWEENDKSSALR